MRVKQAGGGLSICAGEVANWATAPSKVRRASHRTSRPASCHHDRSRLSSSGKTGTGLLSLDRWAQWVPIFLSRRSREDAPSNLTSRPVSDPSSRKPRTLIVIPTYNECDNIRDLIAQIRGVIQADILVIDDNSPDFTAEVVKDIQRSNPSVRLLERSRQLGLASAYLAGFQYAATEDYHLVFEMDADFSHNPKYLPEFLEKIRHADLVIGSRYVEGGGVSNWNRVRRLISKGANLYARLVLRLPIKDLTAGFKCFRVDAVRHFNLKRFTSEGYSFQIEMTYLFWKNGFRVVEIPITFEERREGQSKMSLKVIFEALTRVWQFRLMDPRHALARES